MIQINLKKQKRKEADRRRRENAQQLKQAQNAKNQALGQKTAPAASFPQQKAIPSALTPA